jgi:hypothetical protein
MTNNIKPKKMKTFKSIVICILLISFFGCNKNDPEDLSNVTVEKYIELLKEGKYNSLDLPNFSYEDISALLEYRNENQMITGFPINMISSLGTPECSLGMYVLWTIESIRAVAIYSEYLIGRFPSQNPVVQQRGEPFDLKYGVEIQEIISSAYYDWWEENKNKTFNEFKNIDPLAETEYRWH